MLVVDIPECSLPQNARHIRNLEENHCVGAIPHATPDVFDKVARPVNVFERMPAAYQVSLQVPVALGKKITHKSDPVGGRALKPPRNIAGINARAAVVS